MASIDGRASWRWRACTLVILCLLPAIAPACGGGLFGKVYEYEEDVYVSLDGSADVIVNASVPALVTLRGLALDTNPSARFDNDALRAAYKSPVTEVTRVSRPWRRHGRRFVQVRLHVSDIRRLPQVAPFAWSTYELADKDGLVVYKQNVAASAMRSGTLQNFGWTGGELVAFRLHLPSKIVWHNARDLETNDTSDIARGNILAWEQHLTDRLDGRPIAIEVRMENQSILHRTLWLFAGAFASAILVIGGLIWWTIRKGPKEGEAA
ncbi:MAG TPA: hypothetical protein VFJ02_08730 [Vicinamibacterales bacterium]|nr:hypothetical protein [Vicinamibacterales bacterium]